MPRPRFLLGFRWGRSARRAQSQTATQAAAWSKSKQVTENGWLMSMRLAFGTSTRRAEIARARAAYRSSRMRRATEKGTRLCLFALWLLVRRTRAPLPFELQGDSTWLCLSAAFWSSTLRSFQLPTPPPSSRARAVGKNATEAGQARAKAEAGYRPWPSSRI